MVAAPGRSVADPDDPCHTVRIILLLIPANEIRMFKFYVFLIERKRKKLFTTSHGKIIDDELFGARFGVEAGMATTPPEIGQ